ncbi:MAG: hypothetical protein DRN27_07720, partial [Thermoplasmata archaeon]
VRSGSGTAEDPFIIFNWKIYSLTNPLKNVSIQISNTDAYFIIENCHIYGNEKLSPIGIWLNNVKNGKILNCTCSKTSFGIVLSSSSNNTVENCKCENSKIGLSINGCPSEDSPPSINNTVKNCEFSNCENGIYFCCLPRSSNNLIESCRCYNNNIGILFDHISNYINVVGCNISNNKIGLEVHSTSINNHISNNVFWENDKHSVDNCNNTWDNGPLFGGNFWSGHNISNPYEIPGAGHNKDLYPLNNSTKRDVLIALFTYYPDFPIPGEEICFDASGSYDPAGNIIEYKWDFGDGVNATGEKVCHTYVNGSNYNVTLKVISGDKNDTVVRLITVPEISNCSISVCSGMSIQDAVDNAQPGCSIYVENGTYYENIVVNKPYLNIIGTNKESTIIDGCDKGNVVCITSSFVNISGFTITNSSENKSGIQIGISDYIVDSIGCCIKQNIITENNNGINMSETEQNNICENVISNNNFGISTNRTYSNVFDDNFISHNTFGMYIFWGSNWNIITKNTVTDNPIGLFLKWSHYAKINHNNITSNIQGIKLDNALSPSINYNNIYNNCKYGIIYSNKTGTKNFIDNWWGSKLGPSWILPIFGDKIVGIDGSGNILPSSGMIKFTKNCRPWSKQLF